MLSLSKKILNNSKEYLDRVEKFCSELAKFNEKDIGNRKSKHIDVIENFKTKYNKLIASL